ncbi:putative transcription factor GRAS family [Dioscorea sansibarensis]
MYPMPSYLHDDSLYLNYIDEDDTQNLNLSSNNPLQFLPTLHLYSPPLLPMSFKLGHKRSRIQESNNIHTSKKLCFRDHIGNFKQKFKEEDLSEEADAEKEDEDAAAGMQLVKLLISCAEAVACRDREQATNLLSLLRANAMVLGSSFQRVASCFVQGLTDRLTLVHPLGAITCITPSPALSDKEDALSLVYELCPFIQFGHFIANTCILEAFEGETLVHILDLGMTMNLPHGHQWRNLLNSLASKATPPPLRIRITGIGPSSDRLEKIGEELVIYAKTLGINLEFFSINITLENLNIEHLKINDNEVLVVNSIMQLHCVVKESRGALNSVLQMIHELSPRVFVLVEQDSSHNGPFFLGRFMEALHYYSAIFDSIDAILPKYDTKRAKMEQFYFAEEIKNIVSCEGPARVERHEKVDQWRRRMSRAGFQPASLKMMTEVKQWLAKRTACDGYTVAEEKGSLVLGWKSKPIVAASCWKS